ncbi:MULTISPECIES: MmgE/PrpD family protein [unclassified Chelatococcus]|uniref:MmgE/PrpD family protein n=1 Tax=unclassified Chelatococcus TaxID=2638111 RepID=UPI001BCD4B11|nr:MULTISPECIES: MmgE/PrpD family protein [unclassified Chelatococcus]MBS7697335.1 MmgE/PrpD family protein [Chelatococcus sp. YT9]MBX3556368.1 MmgE/PrpD family protein [Chelatococcus sp.]
MSMVAMTPHDQPVTVAQHVADWMAGLTAAGIPAAARATARRSLIDVVGVIHAGLGMPLARLVREEVLDEAAPGPSRIFGTRRRVAPIAAARANATAAHVLDFDANFNRGMVFGPAALFPALFALAESESASGERFLAAFAIGTEIVRTLAESLSDIPYRKDRDSLFYKGWFNTGVLGPVGVAGAAAWLLGLPREETAQALAIAAVQACGLRIGVGSDMKPLLCARASETGLRAALLARKGVQAPLDAFEGPRGFIRVINAGSWTDEAFAGLGSFQDAGASYKLYPACSSVQAAAEALVRILADHALSAQDVTAVRCEVTPHIAANLAFENPQNVTQAQFSLSYALGCILHRGDFVAADLNADDLVNPAIRAEMAKITMQSGLTFASEAEARDAAEATRITVTRRDGKQFCAQQNASTGKPINPISDALLDKKFFANMAEVLPVPLAKDLLGRIRALESLEDIRLLFPDEERRP